MWKTSFGPSMRMPLLAFLLKLSSQKFLTISCVISVDVFFATPFNVQKGMCFAVTVLSDGFECHDNKCAATAGDN